MQEATTKGIYDLQSFFYDATFGRLVKRRIARAISHMNISETDLILDLGIGTGASLNYFPRRGQIYGIDLSTGMLREARKKIAERNMDHVRLIQADALKLPFADNTFDQVFISHVITVVSDPYRMIREAQRNFPALEFRVADAVDFSGPQFAAIHSKSGTERRQPTARSPGGV